MAQMHEQITMCGTWEERLCHMTSHCIVRGDLIIQDLPEVVITRRCRIDAAWWLALDCALIIAALRHGSDRHKERAISDMLDDQTEKLSHLERRIILGYCLDRDCA